MNEWYCVVAGTRYGPVNMADLLGWAKEGRLGPDDLVWKQDMAEWQPARTIPELAGEANWSAFAAAPMQQAVAPVSGLAPHRGTAVLVLGILGVVFCCTLAMGIIAWVMGSKDLREMNAGRMDPSGRGMTMAGKICGIVGVCVGAAVAILYIIQFAVIFSSVPMR